MTERSLERSYHVPIVLFAGFCTCPTGFADFPINKVEVCAMNIDQVLFYIASLVSDRGTW